MRKGRKNEDVQVSSRTNLSICDSSVFPIDTQEQEEFVQLLEREQARQSLSWRRIFASLLFCYATFLLYCVFHQTMSPWELRHHAYFMDYAGSSMVIAADLTAITVCCMSILGLVFESKCGRQWIWASFFVGFVLSCFWLNCLIRIPRFRWDVLWLPFGPISAAMACLYIDHLLMESSKDIKKLRGYIYTHKAV